MLFNSYVFLFGFLPVAWLAFLLLQKLGRDAALTGALAASLFFYGWWDVRFLPLLLGSIGVNFLLGRALELTAPTRRAPLLALGVIFNLGLLGLFKYADFFLTEIVTLTGLRPEALHLTLPIGISFYTFQQIAYLADVSKGESERYGLRDYALFVSFFPQLIAGPIVHHREMMPQLMRPRGLRAEDAAIGLTMLAIGLVKKVVIADRLALFASPVFAAADAGAPVTMAEAWGAALAYSFQLYFDFSGYSDMAIGLARLFGVRLPINFNSPYQAVSIVDFWRRWHITLSRFLRDYLYIPLGGNRHGKARRYLNLALTMVLGGLWHGAGWGFLIWGALHGAMLALNHALIAAAARLPRLERITRIRPLAIAVTFFFVVLAWVFFRATTLEGATTLARAMLALDGLTAPSPGAGRLTGAVEALGAIGIILEGRPLIPLGLWLSQGAPMILIAALICFLAPNSARMVLAQDPYYEGAVVPARRWLRWRAAAGWAMATALAFVAALTLASSTSEFLYFQF